MSDLTKTNATHDYNVSALTLDLLSQQESAWTDQADSWPIESALPSFNVLSIEDQRQILLDLIFHEVVLRERLGQSPTLEEYQLRFPSLHSDLQMQWQMDELLGRMHDRSAGGTTVEGLQHVGRSAINLPNRIDRYDIIQEIGRGAIGIVYEAFDPELKRTVALKRLKAGVDATREELARMQAESEAVAKIHHPHVVQVYDVGVDGGQPFMAMELCRGGSLGNRLRGNPMPPRQAAELAIQISQAIEAAHQARIIHRDLKPDNIMLMEQTGWDVKVTDFGLAKLMDSDSNATASGCLLGTPTYMAPEQALGDGKNVGPAADVYAIGAILYECISGSPPFRGVTMAETIDLVCHHEPVSLRQLARGAPVDLETIAHKCLQKDPAKRYSSAMELEHDLQRFLAYKPILARKVSSREKLWRLCRRNPIASFLTAAVVLMMLGSIIVLARFNSIIRNQDQEKTIALIEKTISFNERVQAMTELEQANEMARKSTVLANRRFYSAQLNLANEALLQGRAARAELLLQSVRPKNGESDFRGFEWHKLQNDLHRNLLFDVDGHTLEVTCMSVSSDGKRWLVAGGDMNSGYYYIVDVETGNVLHDKKRLGCNVNGCAFDSVRDQFAIAQGNGRLSFFDSRTFEKCGSDETSTTLRSLSVSPDSKWMIGGGDKGEILVINLENKEKQLLPRADQSPIVYSFFAADSMSFYTAVEWGNEGKISRKWSLQSWPPTKERDYPATVLHDISPDGKTLIGTDWGMLSTISTSDGNTLRSEAISSGPIARALYLNADQILVATRSDNEIKMVDSQSLRIDQAYPMHQPVMGLALDRLHQRWGSGDSHGDLRIWSVDQPSDSKPLCMVEAKFAKFLPDGQRVMLAINDSATQVWDPATGKLSPVSNRDNLRAISADGTIQVCESTALEGKKQFDVWTQGLEQPKSVPFEADVNRRGLSLSVTGKWLSVKSEGKPTLVYDLQSRESKPIYKVKGSASGVEISPDDRFLVIAQQFGVVGYFDLQNGVALPNLKELESFWAWGLSVAFSRDGRLVASGNESGIISVWETTSRKQICRLVTGQGEIAALDFFPDGRRLAAGGNGCVLICDVETEQELIRLPTLDTQVTCVDVNDQGTAVCAITNGGHIYYWNGAAK